MVGWYNGQPRSIGCITFRGWNWALWLRADYVPSWQHRLAQTPYRVTGAAFHDAYGHTYVQFAHANMG